MTAIWAALFIIEAAVLGGAIRSRETNAIHCAGFACVTAFCLVMFIWHVTGHWN